jgi:hypothetical protein
VAVKRALGVLGFALAAGGVGSAVIVGTSAVGATNPQAAPPAQSPSVAPPARITPHLQARPNATLHLPSTLKLINQTTGAKTVDNSHTVFYAVLNKPGHHKIIGTSASTCATVTNPLRQDCHGSLALRKGVLLIDHLMVISNGQINGSVVGGSGYYAGAHGTVSGRGLGGGRYRLTVDYSFE